MNWEKIKVVELAGVLAGPLVGTFFAELGASVLKIEPQKTGGDVTQQWRTEGESNQGSSAYYASANWGKTSKLMDLNDPMDFESLIDEIKSADILISNFRAGKAKQLNLDYIQVSKTNPQIIYASINGFGKNNPRPAFDVVLQAETGFMSMNGTSTSGPTKFPLAMIDVLAGHQLKQAILIALLERNQSGKGSEVSISLFDAAVTSLINQGSNFLMNHSIPQPMGSLHPNIAPYGETFDCKDGQKLVLAIGSDLQFQHLMTVLKMASLGSDPKFSSNQSRVENRKELAKILQPIFESQTIEYWEEHLINKGIPAGRIRNLSAVFDLEAAQDLILEEKTNQQNTKRCQTIGFKFHPSA